MVAEAGRRLLQRCKVANTCIPYCTSSTPLCALLVVASFYRYIHDMLQQCTTVRTVTTVTGLVIATVKSVYLAPYSTVQQTTAFSRCSFYRGREIVLACLCGPSIATVPVLHAGMDLRPTWAASRGGGIGLGVICLCIPAGVVRRVLAVQKDVRVAVRPFEVQERHATNLAGTRASTRRSTGTGTRIRTSASAGGL